VEGTYVDETKGLVYKIPEANTLCTLANMLRVDTSQDDTMFYSVAASGKANCDLGKSVQKGVDFYQAGMNRWQGDYTAS
jgi:hypothetical protein